MMEEKEYSRVEELEGILDEIGAKRIFLVSGKGSYKSSGAESKLFGILGEHTRFYDFDVNPKIEDVRRGISLFKSRDYDLIVGVGGGSVMDMAKLIGVLSAQSRDALKYIEGEREIGGPGRPVVAIPTTAGSGAEATGFAVVYVNGKKYSLAHELMKPEHVVLDPSLTFTMPRNLAAVSGMDALSQAIESYWSVNSTEESSRYSREAMQIILENIVDSVNHNEEEARRAMVGAANLSGKAIDTTKTTAPHALSYTFTTELGISHGHAVGLTLGQVLKYNAGVTERDCNDLRGFNYVRQRISEVCYFLGAENPEVASEKIKELMEEVGLETDFKKLGIDYSVIDKAVDGVNIERLKNNPRLFEDKGGLKKVIID